MDGNRFDAFAKSISSTASRRRSLGALLGGGIAVFGLAKPDEAWSAKSGKCRETCGPCEACRKGKCKRKNGRKRCKPGTCELLPGLSECPAGQVRNPTTCGCCQANGQTCEQGGGNPGNLCCSGGCFDIGERTICRGLPAGRRCEFGAQCQSGVCSSQGECT